MIYFLTHTQKSQQDSGQEVSETFSRANLIATTPKGVALLILGVVALASITFLFGFTSGYGAQADLERTLQAMAEREAVKATEYDRARPPNQAGKIVIPVPPPDDAPPNSAVGTPTTPVPPIVDKTQAPVPLR